jgi:NADH-quinone oxidoreductase subunit L
MDITTLCALIPLLPLLGFLINGIGFKRVPHSLVGLIACGMSLGSFAISVYLFLVFLDSKEVQTVKLFDWITVGSLNITFSFLIDQLSLLMLLIVTGIGSLIHIYSVGYMGHDEGYGKFMAFLNLFMFSMLLLVLGANYLIMFIGWEGVGLCSYLLIGFWNTNTSYNYAARKAFVMNRVGDLGFLLGIFLLIQFFGSTEYAVIFAKAGEVFKVGDFGIVLITMLLFVGAMGKSAQIPLYTWLPDAMAGPTPVSALIHAATMVTAGIYMVVRSNVLFTLAPFTSEFIMYIGLATALFAASIGLFQNDIKKVLAYSTVSQLGYMFLGLGVLAYSSAMFHVTTHAFFKALLFLGAGSVIHAIHNEQDMRNMGGLRKHLPITYYTFLIGTIAITGVLPLAGFFSKDEILMYVFMHNPVIWGLGLLGAGMTSFYMFRLLLVTFHGKFRGTEEQKHHLHESPAVMTLPLIILAGLSIVGGFLNVPEVFAEGMNWLSRFMNPLFEASHKVNPAAFHHTHLTHTQEYGLMGASVLVAVASFVLAWFTYGSGKVPKSDAAMAGLPKVIYAKYYIDELYDALIARPILALSTFFYQVGEAIVDFVVEGTGKLVKELSNQGRKLQTGGTGFYVFAMVIGIIVLLAVGFYRFV